MTGSADTPPRVSRRNRKRPRRTRLRSRSIQLKHLTRATLEDGRRALGEFAVSSVDRHDADRPKTRGECADGERPCPWVSCKHHLYLDINPGTGSIKINFPDVEAWDMPQSCSLDAADDGVLTLDAVGLLMNLTRERVRQIETKALLQVRAHVVYAEIVEERESYVDVRARMPAHNVEDEP